MPSSPTSFPSPDQVQASLVKVSKLALERQKAAATASQDEEQDKKAEALRRSKVRQMSLVPPDRTPDPRVWRRTTPENQG